VKKVYAAANLQDAYILGQQLGAAGIDYHIFNENMQGGLGEIPFTHTYPELWIVNESDENKALGLIREFENPEQEAFPRICPNCAEENPYNFLTCWHCGTSIPL